MATVGIGITTHRRPEAIELCLRHLEAFPPQYDYKLVISDDSDAEFRRANRVVIERDWKLDNLTLLDAPENLGIAKNKNECLYNLKDCDYIFLFDDDLWVRKSGWDSLFIEAVIRTGIRHMMYLIPVAGNQVQGEINGVEIYNLSFGCMLFLTKEVIEKIGYMDKRFQRYGFEHSQYSIRAAAAGLTNGCGTYLAPKGTGEYFFSLDFGHNWLGEKPAIGEINFVPRGSLHGYSVEPFIAENSAFFNEIYPLYKEY